MPEPQRSSVVIVRQFVDEVFGRHRLEAIDELFALDTSRAADEHEPSSAYLKRRLAVYLTAFPDLRLSVDQLLASDTEVMVRWSLQGTHTGPLAALPAALAIGGPLSDQDSALRIPKQLYPTGRVVRFQGASSFRVEHGKITWYWLLIDDLSLLRQLGAMPLV